MRAKFAAFIRFSVCSLATTRQIDVIGFGEQRFERHLTAAGSPRPWRTDRDISTCHAERHADRREMPRDRAVAHDADGRAAELAAHARLGFLALAIGDRRVGDAARAIDHHADRHFGDRRHEARRRARHQHACAARRLHVDIADIDRDAQERAAVRREREEFGRARRLAVRHDDLAALRGFGQRLRVEHLAAGVEPHLAELAHFGERARPVIVLQHVGDVGQENAHDWPVGSACCQNGDAMLYRALTGQANRGSIHEDRRI